VNGAVPRHVDEADEFIAVSGAHPAEAVSLDLGPPVVIENSVPETLRVERVDLWILERTAPFVGDCHRVRIAMPAPGSVPRACPRTPGMYPSANERRRQRVCD
jgi:hypothetical protein